MTALFEPAVDLTLDAGPVVLPHALIPSQRSPSEPRILRGTPVGTPTEPPQRGRHRRPTRSARVLAAARDRIVLIAVMAVVAGLAGHLIVSNTAFVDEATYLSAGHVIWHSWMTGGPSAPRITYERYLSGSPVIYPLIANAANAVGGLVAARLFSLWCVLVTLWLLDSTARRMFDRRVAAWSAAVFATVEGTQFLAAFATYDAMAMMLLTLATWLTVREVSGERSSRLGYLLGAPVLALANMTKYATALFDPVVVAVLALVVAGTLGVRAAIRCGLVFTAVVVSLLSAAAALGGEPYLRGIATTTVARAGGTSTAWSVLDLSGRWVGAVTALGVVAVATATYRLRATSTADQLSPSRVLLVGVLLIAVLLVPLDQARIETATSLHKHVTFGAWFGAIAAGVALAWVAGTRLRAVWRWLPAVALVVALGVIGTMQAQNIYASWARSTDLVAFLRPLVSVNGKPIVMDDADLGRYYLPQTAPSRWHNTYYLRVFDRQAQQYLTGPSAYEYAVAHNSFGVVVLAYGSQYTIDHDIQNAIEANPSYRYVGAVKASDSYGPFAYQIWADTVKASP